LVENETKITGVLSKGDRLSLIKRLTRETYEGESDDVKAEVARRIEERATPEEEHQPTSEIRTPAEYQRYVYHVLKFS